MRPAVSNENNIHINYRATSTKASVSVGSLIFFMEVEGYLRSTKFKISEILVNMHTLKTLNAVWASI